MQLLYPYFLVAGLVLIIPIIIHLFNLRKFKTVYYSDTSLLEEIVLKSKKKKTIKELLILLTRLTLLAALVFAFAYPFLGNQTQEETGKEIAFLDNSKSAAVFNDEHEIFQEEKDLMYQVYESKNELQFLSNDIKVLNPLDQEGLFDLINQSVITPQQLNIKDINELISLNKDSKALTIFSPFSTAFDLTTIDSIQQKVTLVHFDSKDVAKVVIDTLWIDQFSKQEDELTTIHLNYLTYGQNTAYDFKLFVNDELRGSKTVSTKNGQVQFNTHFSENSNYAVVKSYNKQGQEVAAFYFVVREQQQYQITLIGMNKQTPLAKAFSDETDFRLFNYPINQIDFEKTLSSDLVFINYNNKNHSNYQDILNQLLKKDIKVCLFFDDQVETSVLQPFSIHNKKLKDTVKVKTEQPNSTLYAGVFLNKTGGVIDLPQVNRSNKLTGLLKPLLKNEFNEPIIAQSITEPNLFISTENFAQTSSFTNHSLFIPTVYQFLFFENMQKDLFVRPNTYYDLPAQFQEKKSVQLMNSSDSSAVKVDVIKQGENQLILLNEKLSSGWYQLRADSVITLVAINEQINNSSYVYRSLEDLQLIAKNDKHINVISSKSFDEQQRNLSATKTAFPLWKYFILVALIFLCFETILINFKSKNPYTKKTNS